MNEQLLPIDMELQTELARRASGRLPDELLSGVMTALDAAPDRALPWRPAITWRTPRFAFGAAGTAFAMLLLAVLLIAPLTQSGPAAAGYPAGRPLTTTELASLMSGPALQTNTTLVAQVVMDSNSNVCPMDRYPTWGVLEGMASQICVMGGITPPYPATPKASGVYAFRYLAPGYLGLIGEVTRSTSSRLSFRVADDWPLAGTTFLVQGWLGSTAPCESIDVGAYSPGDLLSPAGPEPCGQSWLSDSERPSFTGTPVPSGTAASTENLGMNDGVRLVGAWGMRFYDSVVTSPGSPVYGTWAVKSSGGPCPNDPPVSSRGCGYWLVMARIPDVPQAAASASPVPTAARSDSAPITPITPVATPPAVTASTAAFERPMTTAELAAFVAGPAPAVNTTFVATATIDAKGCLAGNVSGDGAVEAMNSQLCVTAAGLTTPQTTGVFAFRYLGPGLVMNLGRIEPASTCRLLWHGADNWPGHITEVHTFLVGGYLVNGPSGWTIVDNPDAATTASGQSARTVEIDTDAYLGTVDPSRYDVYVVTARWVGGTTSTTLPDGNGAGVTWDGVAFHLRARVSAPNASATPSAGSGTCGPAPSV